MSSELILTGAKIAVKHDQTSATQNSHQFCWIDQGSLYIKEGRIAGIYQTQVNPSAISKSARVVSLNNQAVIPALVNGHTHLSQTFLRGLASGRSLLEWLKELIWPLQRAFSPELLELAALLGLAENTRSGVSQVINHHKITLDPTFSAAVIRAAQLSGLKVTFARAWADVGEYGESPEAIISDLTSLFSHAKRGGKIKIASGPLTAWRCSAATLAETHQLALEHGSFSHIHLSETQNEVEMTVKETGLRPVTWLAELGLLDANFQIVHAVWVNIEEIKLLAETQAPVIHCPVSNAVLGSGVAPVKAMLEHGVRVSLGTDGSASNDTQDSFQSMKMALCLARVSALEGDTLSPKEVLHMATRSTGLSVGEPADLAIVDLDSVWSSPVHDVESALVLSCGPSNMWGLLVDGDFVMYDRQLTLLDEPILIKEAQSAIKILRKKAGLD